MWSASLKINVNGIHTQSKYYFKTIRKYIHLYQDLPDILVNLGYPQKLIKDSSQVSFDFEYLNKKVFVDDWDKYILQNEKISITVSPIPVPSYVLVDSFQDDKLVVSTDLQELYKYCYKCNFNSIHPVLIYVTDIKLNKTRLLDVIENPKAHLNACINRLIHKYNY